MKIELVFNVPVPAVKPEPKAQPVVARLVRRTCYRCGRNHSAHCLSKLER